MANKKRVGFRGLAILMTLVMMFSVLQISAAAKGSTGGSEYIAYTINGGAQVQIASGSGDKWLANGTYDISDARVWVENNVLYYENIGDHSNTPGSECCDSCGSSGYTLTEIPEGYSVSVQGLSAKSINSQGSTYDNAIIDITIDKISSGDTEIPVDPTKPIPNPINVPVAATKVISGDAYELSGFSFKLVDESGNEYTAVSDVNGDISFSIPAAMAGTYVYTITEIIPANPVDGMSYDDHAETVTFEIGVIATDENTGKETLGVTSSAYDADGAVFTNSYDAPEPPAPPVEPDPINYTLVVNWVDEAGAALADSTSEVKEEGSAYVTSAKSFEGYELKEITGDAVSGTMDSDKAVTYIYKLKEIDPPAPPVIPDPINYTLITNWVDEAGADLATSTSETKEENSEYATEQKSFDGYELKEVSGDATSGIMNSDKAVTYIYKLKEIDPPAPPVIPDPINYTLVVNWVNEAGAALADSTSEVKEEGSAYATSAKSFEGYELKEVTGDAVSGTMDSDKAVTYIYKLIPVAPPYNPPYIPPVIPPVIDDEPVEEPVEIPEEDVPLVEVPEEVEELEDEDVPLADVPKTGDPTALFAAAAAASGIAWIGLKKKEDEE